MSIATEITRLQGAKADLKTAIENKGVTVSSSALLDAYPALVDSIPTGGGAVKEKTVNFIDFDGTLVASYTGAEVQALTALPDGPDHSSDEVPLTFDGWNWTLSEIKSNNTSYPSAIITVGALYHTTDNKYHFWFDTTGINECYVAFKTGANTTGTVDWGDGSAIESFSDNSTVEHKYTNGLKNHCIADTSGSISWGSGDGINSNKKLSLVSVRWPSQTTAMITYWCMHLEDMSIPSGATFFDTTNCKSLKCIIFPRGVTQIDSNIAQPSLRYLSTTPYITSFSGNIRFTALTSLFLPGVTSATKTIDQNYQLRNVCLPNLVLTSNNYDLLAKNNTLLEATFSNQSTILPYRIFQQCYSLNKANIPTSVTTIENNAFSYCQGLREVTIPAGVTAINTGAFDNVSFQYITSLATTPPTLSSAFSDSNSGVLKVYVPYSADHSVLTAYQAATNWSNLATKMEELPQ